MNKETTQTKNGSYLYHYKALVTAAYDGDTITVDIDQPSPRLRLTSLGLKKDARHSLGDGGKG